MLRSKLFWAMFVLKLVLGSLVASHYLAGLFIPFVNYFVESHFSNPWTHFAAIGRPNSFPYPPLMLYVFAVPRLLASRLLPGGTETVSWLHLLIFRLPLLLCDLEIAGILAIWFPGRDRQIIGYYWCSPLVLYVCYWHGQLDIVPTALFVLCLYLLGTGRVNSAMLVFGLALGTKTHLFAAVPFLIVYMAQEIGFVRALRSFGISLLTFVVLVLPCASPAFMFMVFGTQEQGRIVALQVPIGSQMWLLVAPAAILFLWYRFLAYRQLNWDLLMLYLGILFSIFILLAPPAPGYVLWSLPFLIYFLCRSRSRDAIAFVMYEIAYIVFAWARRDSDLFSAWQMTMPSIARWPSPSSLLERLNPGLSSLVENMSFTVLQASLAGVVLFVYLIGVKRNEAHNARTKPIMIGIAGDSGAGKDTFSNLLTEIMGESRVACIGGDDYHRWPRGHGMWNRYTHLDPRANKLHQQQRDAMAFASGKPALKTEYDHYTGTYSSSKWTDPEDVMIFQGLHTLSIEAMRQMFDLSIFLDPDESLRYKWKIERDGRQRGYTPEQVMRAFQKRQHDRETSVLPQMEHADIVVRWKPEAQAAGELSLEVVSTNSFDLEVIVAGLTSIETLVVEHEYSANSKQRLQIAGNASLDSLQALDSQVLKHDPMYRTDKLRAGLDGCLQLLIARCLSEKLSW